MTGWWPGDGNTDDIVGDRTAVLRDDATFGAGHVGDAFVLDGSGDFVEVPHDPALDVGSGDFTVDLWVKFNDSTGEQVLVEKWVQHFDDPPTSTGWTFTKLADNSIGLFTADGLGKDNGARSTPLTIPPNTWVHLAARRSGSTIEVLMNGVVVASNTDPPEVVDLDTAASLKFGHRGSPDDTPGSLDLRGFFLNGRIDEVELFVGRALSDAEIQDIVMAGSAGKCIYNFQGFFPPVDNLPTLNRVNAGRAIPVKFSLGGEPGAEHLCPRFSQVTSHFVCLDRTGSTILKKR
jgi:hypothetical protein